MADPFRMMDQFEREIFGGDPFGRQSGMPFGLGTLEEIMRDELNYRHEQGSH